MTSPSQMAGFLSLCFVEDDSTIGDGPKFQRWSYLAQHGGRGRPHDRYRRQ